MQGVNAVRVLRLAGAARRLLTAEFRFIAAGALEMCLPVYVWGTDPESNDSWINMKKYVFSYEI